MRTTVWTIVVALAAAGLAGCENKPPRPKTGESAAAGASQIAPTDRASVQRADNAMNDAKRTAADNALTASVRQAIAQQAGVDPGRMSIDANGGVVVIRGQVDRDETKHRIQEIVRAVPGVKWVQNQLSVAPGAAPKAAG